MNSKTIYNKLPGSVREKLRSTINITNNEEFVSWMTNIPQDVLKEHFGISEKVISKVRKSELYQTFSQSNYQNRFGYNPEPESDLTFGRSNDSEAVCAEIIDKVPSKVSLSHRYRGVQDQGNVGSCVGFGIEGSLRSALDFKFPLSSGFAYKVAKLVDGKQHQGTSLNACIKGIQKYGICREGSYPYSSDKMFKEIPARIFRDAKKIKLVKYQDQNTSDYNLLEWIIGCLSGLLFDKPLAVAIGTFVFKSSWRSESTRATGKLLEPYAGESHTSGHSVTLIGYVFDSSFPGGGYFIFRNSWGPKWAWKDTYCPAGYGIMSFSYAAKYVRSAIVGINLSVISNEEKEELNEVVKSTKIEELGLVAASANSIQNNPHKVYCGKSGSGKTTKLKSDIIVAKENRYAIIDIHGDISGGDKQFVNKTDAKVWDIIKHGLPYNILGIVDTLDGDLSDDKIRLLKTEWLVGCFKACIPDLGSRQLSMLREELEQQLFAYYSLERTDIQLSGILKSINKKRSKSGPTSRIAESLFDQLRPVFKLGLLDCKHQFSLQDLLEKNKNIIFKCDVPSEMDHVLRLISVFLVSGIFSVYKISDLGKKQRGVIVQDEFHLMPKHPVWEKITREGRKFGIELWASSQNVDELKDLLPNVGQRNVFRVAAGNQAKEIANQMGWTAKHKKEIIKILSSLKNFEYFDPLDVVVEN